MTSGIIIASDTNSETLLPWWWERYSAHCQLPVALVDLGISSTMRHWCDKRMQVISLNSSLKVSPPHQIDARFVKQWKKQHRGPLWKAREAWFKKPQACQLSPFDLTLWLDLDCEVCGELDSLFIQLAPSSELAIGLQHFLEPSTAPIVYNSGVILFRKNAPFLHEWDIACRANHSTKMGDQDVLTELLLNGNVPFQTLSPYYNWLMYAGIVPGIVIAHWAAGWGKEYIRKYGGLTYPQSRLLVR